MTLQGSEVAFLARIINTNRLSSSLLIRILLFSGLFTIGITSLQLYLDYKDEIKQLEYKLVNIQKNHLKPLSTALWDYNEPLAQQQIEGFVGIEGIKFTEVRTNYGKIYTAGNNSTENVISRSFDIIYNDTNFGVLKVYADKNYAKIKLFFF
tara:strand:- start:75 stop:530 length:456 start_codon:yes stop_codon:yes gene_type:complete